jgi:hypothetical protein
MMDHYKSSSLIHIANDRHGGGQAKHQEVQDTVQLPDQP